MWNIYAHSLQETSIFFECVNLILNAHLWLFLGCHPLSVNCVYYQKHALPWDETAPSPCCMLLLSCRLHWGICNAILFAWIFIAIQIRLPPVPWWPIPSCLSLRWKIYFGKKSGPNMWICSRFVAYQPGNMKHLTLNSSLCSSVFNVSRFKVVCYVWRVRPSDCMCMYVCIICYSGFNTAYLK